MTDPGPTRDATDEPARDRAHDPTDPTRDPTRMRSQRALTTSHGAIWLVVGGLFAAVSLAVLVPMAWLPGGAVGVVCAIAVAVLYAAMVVVRLAVPAGRRRLGLLAGGMIAMAVVALGGVVAVAAVAWEGLASR